MVQTTPRPPRSGPPAGTPLPGAQLGLWSALAAPIVRRELSNPLFRAVMEASHSAFLIVNPERRILYANRALAELTGYSLHELVALPSSDVLTAPAERMQVERELQAAFGGACVGGAHRRGVLHRDGHRIPVAASTRPLVIEGEVLALVIELSSRASEEAAMARVRAHSEALRASNAELEIYREMVARASDAIMIVVEDRVVVRNASYRERLGFDVLGHALDDMLEGEPLAEARGAVGRIARGESEAERILFPLVSAHGEQLEMEATLSPIDLAGQPAVLAVLRDVSARLALERHMRVRERLDALGRVSAGAAHELANTLGSLIGAMAPDTSPEITDAVDRARRLARGLALVGGQEVGRAKAVPVRPLLRAAVDALPPELADRVQIEQAAPGSLGSVNGRRDDLVLALSALIMNALEASDGPARVRLSTVVGLPDGAQPEEPCPDGYCLVEISDAGPGMPPADLSRLFEPFFTTKPGRTGLGASLAYSVIRAHGGQTTAASVEGEGTTVRVTLPRRQAASTRRRTRRAAPADAGTRRVLLADDNDALRTVTAAILRGAGFEVTESATAEHARAVIESDAAAAPFDALVLDMRLGDGSGLDLFEAAGGLKSAPPTLFISGYSGDELGGLPASDQWQFLMKPFGRDDLLRHLTAVIRAA